MRLLLFALIVAACAAQEYSLRHSFQAPFHAHTQLPFWDVGGGARVEENFVRLTPARQSRIGFAWNNVPSTMSEWEVELEFQVTGEVNLGGEGFAFWYAEKAEMLGPVYGSMDYWNGLGIFFDTYNNDNSGEFPVISVVVNDGRLKYDFATDGATQASATCSAQFRNLDQPSKARIKYQNRQLSVEVSLRPGAAYEPCLTVPDLELGVDKFFGLSAQTGDVADNHDIFSFVTRNLSPANVDLGEVRARYRQKLHAQNPAETAAQSLREMMDPKQFQDEVLGLLNQIQSAQNLMETSQIAMANLLSAGSSTSDGSASADTSVLHTKIADLSQQQRRVVDTLDSVLKAVDGMSGRAPAAQQQAPQMMNSVSALQRDVATTNSHLTGTVNPKMSQLVASTQNCNDKIDALSRVVEKANAQAARIAESSGGGGWGTSLVMILGGAALGYGVSYMSNRRDRSFKLP